MSRQGNNFGQKCFLELGSAGAYADPQKRRIKQSFLLHAQDLETNVLLFMAQNNVSETKTFCDFPYLFLPAAKPSGPRTVRVVVVGGGGGGVVVGAAVC